MKIQDMPLDYINKLEKKQHIMLLYENPDYARLIEFQFMRNGLRNSEHVILVTKEDLGQIISKMVHYGIPVEDSIRKNRLHLFSIQNPLEDKDGIIASCQKTLSKILQKTNTPRRMVCRFVPDVSTVSGMSAELEIEKYGHEHFDDFGGMVMCPYDLSTIESKNRNKWLDGLYENHHAVIYLKKSGQGAVTTSE